MSGQEVMVVMEGPSTSALGRGVELPAGLAHRTAVWSSGALAKEPVTAVGVEIGGSSRREQTLTSAWSLRDGSNRGNATARATR